MSRYLVGVFMGTALGVQWTSPTETQTWLALASMISGITLLIIVARRQS